MEFTIKRARSGQNPKNQHLTGKRGLQYINKAIKNHDVHTLLSIIDQLYQLNTPESIQKCNELKSVFEKILIGDSDDTAYPRCEFYTRFYGSSLYVMALPRYWNTYHRSERTRFFTKAGGRCGHSYQNSCMQATGGHNAPSSHLGNVRTPTSLQVYRKRLLQNRPIKPASVNLRDALLQYRLTMAKSVVTHFSQNHDNRQMILSKDSTTGALIEKERPIIHTDHDYPCVVVHIPIKKSSSPDTDASRFWSEHSIDFQSLQVCVFLAYVNTQANIKKIPIEMVLRSSFGHNLPSACPTGSSFRINTGIIPEVYAEVIADALIKTIEALHAMQDHDSTEVIDQDFADQIFRYNAHKLKEAINRNKSRIYHSIKSSSDFTQINDPDCYQKVRLTFETVNRIQPKNKRSQSIEVRLLKGMTSWQAIRQQGNSGGRTVLSECFRRKGSMDWFIDRLIKAIDSDPAGNPIDFALTQLIRQLNYSGKKVSMPKATFPKHKIFFQNASFSRYYKNDPPFLNIITQLFVGLGHNKNSIPKYGLYAEIEKAGQAFITQRRSQFDRSQTDEDDYGSDSEFEEDYHYTSKKYSISHLKLRVVNGMKAITAAHHGALKYLESIGMQDYTQDVSSMYFEVEPSLPMIKMSNRLKKLPKSPQGHLSLLYFDLNCNNHDNACDRNDLNEMLDSYQPIVIMLDITSASTRYSLESLKQCLAQSSVNLVLLVESGLKHSQAGLDYNPYGEIRIVSKDKKISRQIFNYITKGLSEDDKLAPQAHRMVRALKNRGFARSFHGLFTERTPRARYAPVSASFQLTHSSS